MFILANIKCLQYLEYLYELHNTQNQVPSMQVHNIIKCMQSIKQLTKYACKLEN